MQKLILSLFAILSMTNPSHSQSSPKRYASHITPDGTIFFINPQKLHALTNLRRFEYDMTLPGWTDSVTVNFSFESSLMDTPDNLKITNNKKTYPCNDFSVLFIDIIKKHHYKIRITSKFSTHELIEILETASVPTFSFTQNGIREEAAYKDKKWKKEQPKLLDILHLYSYSKNQRL